MSRGVLRALRGAMELPLAYRLDEDDYRVISHQQAQVLGTIGFFAMLLGQLNFIGGWWKR